MSKDPDFLKAEEEAVDAALQAGGEGDLLVVFGDNITRCWKQIIYFGGERNSEEDIPDIKEENLGDSDLGVFLADGQQLISDERGVRLARDEEGDD